MTSSNSTTHSSPARRAASRRSAAISFPRSRVISRWRWQNAASRTACMSITARIVGGLRSITAVAMSRRSCQAVTRSSSRRTSDSSSAIARTIAMYCS